MSKKVEEPAGLMSRYFSRMSKVTSWPEILAVASHSCVYTHIHTVLGYKLPCLSTNLIMVSLDTSRTLLSTSSCLSKSLHHSTKQHQNKVHCSLLCVVQSCPQQQVTRNVKISRLSVLPAEVQVAYGSSHFRWPAIGVDCYACYQQLVKAVCVSSNHGLQ